MAVTLLVGAAPRADAPTPERVAADRLDVAPASEPSATLSRIQHGGLVFELSAQRTWRAPGGKRSSLELHVDATNETSQPVDLEPELAIAPVLSDARGVRLQAIWGRDATRYVADDFFRIAPHGSVRLIEAAILERHPGSDLLDVSIFDYSGGAWTFEGVAPGDYRVAVEVRGRLSEPGLRVTIARADDS